MMGNDERIAKLEDDVVELRIGLKVAETNIETVTKSVDIIKSNTGKLVWLVGSALVLTLLNLILKGGMTL